MIKKIVVFAVLLMCLIDGAQADVNNWLIGCIAGGIAVDSQIVCSAVQNYYGVQPDASDGLLAAEDSYGAPLISTTAYVRDYTYGATQCGYGLIKDIRQPFTSDAKEWTVLLGCGSRYMTSKLFLRFWAYNMSYDCPSISVQITRGLPGTNFTTGTTLIGNWDKSYLGTKIDPAYCFELTDIIPQLMAGDTLELKMTATMTPEPGGLIAIFGGIISLVGFKAVHRR